MNIRSIVTGGLFVYRNRDFSVAVVRSALC